jgi:putative transposase
MPEYRRPFEPGGMFFFTVVTHCRQPFLCDPIARQCLRQAFQMEQADHPFEILGIVLMPDHLHCIWKLPEDDPDFSKRWGRVKKDFTHRWLTRGGGERERSSSRYHRRERGVWQRRFWEHMIRDERDFIAHLDYIHYNPVKHDHVSCPHLWEFSSFHRWVKSRHYEPDWQCQCQGNSPKIPDFDSITTTVGE